MRNTALQCATFMCAAGRTQRKLRRRRVELSGACPHVEFYNQLSQAPLSATCLRRCFSSLVQVALVGSSDTATVATTVREKIQYKSQAQPEQDIGNNDQCNSARDTNTDKMTRAAPQALQKRKNPGIICSPDVTVGGYHCCTSSSHGGTSILHGPKSGHLEGVQHAILLRAPFRPPQDIEVCAISACGHAAQAHRQ
eukprot:gene24513-biopygen20901